MSITTETRREAHEMVMPHKLCRRQEILEILAVHGPMTAEDVTEHLVFDGKIPAFDQNAARPRLTELKQLGRVEVVGKRESRRSGRKTALWAIKERKVMTIYQIDSRLMELIDPDTGELRDYEEYAALQVEREVKIEHTALWIKNLLADSKAIREEEIALADRRRMMENRAKSLKEYLSYALDGAKFSTPKVAISFRHSQAVEVDDEFIAWAQLKAPDLLKFKEPEPDKTAISASIKSGAVYEYARIAERNNIQIK